MPLAVALTIVSSLLLGAFGIDFGGLYGIFILYVLSLVIAFAVIGLFGGNVRSCTVCQKQVQTIGGLFSRRRCPMCGNSLRLQRLK
jgi:hypothetical protein